MNNYAVTIALTKIENDEVFASVSLSTNYYMTEKLAIAEALKSDQVNNSLSCGYQIHCKIGLKLNVKIL